MTRRLAAIGMNKYEGLINAGKHHFNGVVKVHPEVLQDPIRARKPQRIFVNSMSDLFHEGVPLAFIQDVFETMVEADWHQFQILTKRPARALELSGELPWPSNVWLGTSVEDGRVLERINHLREVPAAVRFLSLEPLIGPLNELDLTNIDWVIVGGESGPKSRPMKEAWVLDIRDQCQAAGVAFFFKQWGGPNKKATGRLLDGRTYDEYPLSLAA